MIYNLCSLKSYHYKFFFHSHRLHFEAQPVVIVIFSFFQLGNDPRPYKINYQISFFLRIRLIIPKPIFLNEELLF